MCGICGIYGIEDKSVIEKMLVVLHHRGPDDRSIVTDTDISLGHARLSIIDLSVRGRQPMSNEDGNIWLSANGEIYNFTELKMSLEKEGHIFFSQSDNEVIIHAYEQYGLEFVKKLRGMFAFALYDKVQHKIILGRDPIGKKPLYYYYDGKILIFASEIKAILAAGIKPHVNMQALSAYLAYQYSLGEQTLFSGIKKVLAGHIKILQNTQLCDQKYWDISEHLIQSDEFFYQSKLRALLEESTKLRMVADVPIGAFLSGGIDSSAVVALARPHVTSDFHTFSVGFETYSEIEYANIVSDFLDTVHHNQIVTDTMVAKELRKIAWLFDEPLGDAAIINNYFLSKDAKKYVTVVLAGEGGDELFAGYNNYYYNLYAKRFLKNKLISLVCKKMLNRVSNIEFLMNNVEIKKTTHYAGYLFDDNIENLHQNTTRLMDTNDKELHTIFNLPKMNVNSLAIFPNNVNTELGKMLAMDCKNLLPEKFLMKSDKGTMANSIEERLPLLDKNVIEFAFSTPSQYKIRNHVGKYIFRKSISDLLPEKIVKRPKQGFKTTIGDWMENGLHDIVIQTIDGGILLSNIMNSRQKSMLVQNLNNEMKKYPTKIWNIFALELWYTVFFINNGLHQ